MGTGCTIGIITEGNPDENLNAVKFDGRFAYYDGAPEHPGAYLRKLLRQYGDSYE